MTTSSRRPFFKKKCEAIALGELTSILGARLLTSAGEDPGPEMRGVHITGVSSLAGAGDGDVALYAHRFYIEALRSTGAAACLVAPSDLGCVSGLLAGKSVGLLLVERPSLAFAELIDLFYEHDPRLLYAGGLWSAADGFALVGSARVHSSAFVHHSAHLESGVVVEAFAYVGPGCVLGSGTVVAPHAVVGAGCVVGKDSFLGPHASLACCLLGDAVVVHAGARIGQDGFGYGERSSDGIRKVPHVGCVVIESGAEIGANTTIDRAVVDRTVIGPDTKVDNLVQIGHNARVGSSCLIAGQSGVSGSTSLGDNVRLGGQVGLKDHISIGSNVQLGAGSGVMHDVPDNQVWVGFPAENRSTYIKKMLYLNRLVDKANAADKVIGVEGR